MGSGNSRDHLKSVGNNVILSHYSLELVPFRTKQVAHLSIRSLARLYLESQAAEDSISRARTGTLRSLYTKSVSKSWLTLEAMEYRHVFSCCFSSATGSGNGVLTSVRKANERSTEAVIRCLPLTAALSVRPTVTRLSFSRKADHDGGGRLLVRRAHTSRAVRPGQPRSLHQRGLQGSSLGLF